MLYFIIKYMDKVKELGMRLSRIQSPSSGIVTHTRHTMSAAAAAATTLLDHIFLLAFIL